MINLNATCATCTRLYWSSVTGTEARRLRCRVQVFFDTTIAGEPSGRIVMEVCFCAGFCTSALSALRVCNVCAVRDLTVR